MKRVFSLAIAALAGQLVAGTYIWTGEGNDGKWFTRENWKYDDGAGNVTNPAAAAPKNNCSDDITIDGQYEVSYKPGGDLQISGTLTLANGAYWKQIDGGAYVDVKGGTIHVCQGGVFDSGSSTGSNGVGLGNVIVENGGKVIARRNFKRASLTVKAGGVYELDGGYEFAATDDIQSGGLLTATGNVTLPADMRIISTGYISTTGEFKPSSGSEFANVNLTNKLASMDGKCSLLSGSLTFSGTQNGGLYQAGSDSLYFDFPAGSTCRITLKDTLSSLYSRTFGTSTTTPKYRYDGAPISAQQFETLFETADNGDGTVTFWPKAISEDAPEVATGTVTMGSTDGSVLVSATFAKVGDPAAQVYLVYGTEDKGRKFTDWGDNKILLGTASASGLTGVTASGLPARQMLFFRVFAVNEEGTSASDSTRLYTRNYGVDGVVNEWIGTEGNWTDGTQWSLGHQPTDSEIRWIEKADAVVTKNNYTLNDTDHMVAGTLALTGELYADVDYVLDGFNFSCTTFVPSGNKFTIKNGSLTAYRSGAPEQAKGGVYGDGARVDVLSGGVMEMRFYSTGNVYAETFGGNRFTFNGLKIDETEFNKRFAYDKVDGVSEVVRGDDTYYAYRLYLKPSEGEPKVESFGATFSDGQITFTLQQAEDSISDTVVTVYYGTTDHGATTNDWAASAVMPKDGNGINTATLAVTPGSRYYYAILAESETADMMVWRTGDVVAASLPTDRKVWFGVSSDASDPANWQGGVLPGPTDVIEIGDLFGKNLTINWNSTAIPAVAGWIQSAGIVYFDTTPTSAVTVSGDVALSGTANWTHIGPAGEPSYCVNVQVVGNLTIAADAKIAVNQKGYHRAGPGKSFNYGTLEDGEETRQLWTGGSYAGDAGHPTYTGTFVSYGSILNPIDWGSAGKGDNDEKGYSGGGLVILTVGGSLTVNGNIEANGFGYNLNDFAGSSGGTINVTAGTVTGIGKITANGGNCNCGPGGGGRIRVELTGANSTFNSFGAPDHIVANSGTLETTSTMTTKRDTMIGAAGTITLVSSGETKVIVADTCTTRREPTTETLISATHLPARQNPTENLRHSIWSLNGYGKIRLTANASIGGLSLSATDGTQCVFTDGYTLTTASLVVNGTRYRYGTYTATTNPEFIKGVGSIVVGGSGFILMIR